jgi:hypothetical protein
MSGLRTWARNQLQKPVLLLHERVDGVKDEVKHDLEILRDDVQHRARHLEVRVAAWGVAAALLVVCGLFLLMGLWFGLSAYIGAIGASFTLSALFGFLAAIPLAILPRELAQLDASQPSHPK